MATTVTSLAATRTSSSTAASAIAIAATTRTSLTRTAALWTRDTCFNRHSIHTIKVRLIVGIEIRAAFNYCGRGALRCALRCTLRSTARAVLRTGWRR